MKSAKLLTFEQFRNKEVENLQISNANQIGKSYTRQFTLFQWNGVPCSRYEFDMYRYSEYIKDNTELGEALYG